MHGRIYYPEDLAVAEVLCGRGDVSENAGVVIEYVSEFLANTHLPF